MKLQLPSVTLMCIDCVDAGRAIKVLEHCKTKADFGAVKLLTSIPSNRGYSVRPNYFKDIYEIIPLNSLIAYSIFMLTKVHEYIDTEHVLIVQRDGWILNPETFNQAWLELDYIGPLFMQVDKVGSGGFSLRKKTLMQSTAMFLPKWDGTQQEADIIQKRLGYYEDGVICLDGHKFKIASLGQAANFAQGGNRNPAYFREKPFGFHRTWQEIDFKTGIVDSSDLTKDLHISYDKEIDAL